MSKQRPQEEITEPIQESALSKRNKYEDDVNLYQLIVENKNAGKNWTEITETLKLRGYDSINPGTVQNIFNKVTAKATITHNTAKELFTDHTKVLNEMYTTSIGVLGSYIKKLRQVIDKLDNEADDELAGKLMIIKTIPVAVTLMKEIRECVQTQMDLQDKITKTAEKEVIFTEAQMMEIINEHLPNLEKAGVIKILSPTLKNN